MVSETIIVPSTGKIEDWFDFVNRSLTIVNSDEISVINELIVDFNKVNFLDTDDFVILACLLESFHSKDCSIKFIGGTEKFNHHLYNIKFKDYWKEGFDRCKFTLSYNKYTLCLWKVSEEMIYSYSSHAKNYFEGLIDNKNLVTLSSNLDEVFNNIFDHSNSPVDGYIITQYYPRKNKISFSLCDFGIGIPTAVNAKLEKNGQKTTENWMAILKALELGFSTNSTPRNRGFGLNNIFDLTETKNGRLIIISNNGYLEKGASEMYKGIDIPLDFKGTLIKVEVDVELFEDKGEVDEFFDF
jgi:hypothetical protein